jgi:hypothetical protein
MIDFFGGIGLKEIITGAAVGTAVGGFILKKFGLVEKIERYIEVANNWLKKAEGPMNTNGQNAGILITTKGNNLPFIGVIYEHTFEPILCLLLGGLSRIILTGANLLVIFVRGVVEGMKSDNKDFKSGSKG